MTTPLLNTATKIDLSGGTGGAGGQSVYTAANGVVVTSSAPTYTNGSLYYLGYIFNGNKDTGANTDLWLTSSSGNQTLTFDMDGYTNDPITQISVYPRSRSDASSNYSIDVSNDGSSWTEIVPLVTNSTSLALGTERLHDGLNVTERYIRFNLTRNGDWGVTLHEIELYEDAGGGAGGGGPVNDDSYKILEIEPVYMQDFGGVEEAPAAPVSNERLLWRYIVTSPSAHGSNLWDLEPSGSTSTGWYNGATQVTTGVTLASQTTLGDDKWGVFSSGANPLTGSTYTGAWDAGPSSGTLDYNVGGRSSVSLNTGMFVAVRFSTEVTDITRIYHRTYAGGRADRIPSSAKLQYYNGDLNATYDDTLWVDYATLNHGGSIAWVRWDITEGGTITSINR